MNENKLQAYLIREVKTRGLGIAVKVDCSSRRGWPDLVVIPLGGETQFVELKTETGQLSLHQIAVIDAIQFYGGRVLTLYGKAAVDDYLKQLAPFTRSQDDYQKKLAPFTRSQDDS